MGSAVRRNGIPGASTSPISCSRPRLLQQTPVRIGHRPAKLVPQKPDGLVAADAGAGADLSLSLQLIHRDAVRMAGGDVRRHEPGAQRKMAAMHHRRLQPGSVAGPRTFPGGPDHGSMPGLCESRKPSTIARRPAPVIRPDTARRPRHRKRAPRTPGATSDDLISSGWAWRNNTGTRGQQQARPTTSRGTGLKGISLDCGLKVINLQAD